jgi:hypothetical protein
VFYSLSSAFSRTAGLMPNFNTSAVWGTTEIKPFESDSNIFITVPNLFLREQSAYAIESSSLILWREGGEKEVIIENENENSSQDIFVIEVSKSQIFG